MSLTRHICKVPPPSEWSEASSSDTDRNVKGSSGAHWKSATCIHFTSDKRAVLGKDFDFQLCPRGPEPHDKAPLQEQASRQLLREQVGWADPSASLGIRTAVVDEATPLKRTRARYEVLPPIQRYIPPYLSDPYTCVILV